MVTFLAILNLLVNLSPSTGEFCASRKTAIVTPLLKKPNLDCDAFKNYRPVSNLSFVFKSIERLVSIQLLIAHLTANNLYDKFQSACCAMHLTETVLLHVQNDLLQAFDSQGGAILVLLNLSAAFDTIDHAALLHALERRCGISGIVLKWFAYHLTNRPQAVKIGQSISDFIKVVFGVPQGSVLGPILFTLPPGPSTPHELRVKMILQI
jgi:hypothetical protein